MATFVAPQRWEAQPILWILEKLDGTFEEIPFEPTITAPCDTSTVYVKFDSVLGEVTKKVFERLICAGDFITLKGDPFYVELQAVSDG